MHCLGGMPCIAHGTPYSCCRVTGGRVMRSGRRIGVAIGVLVLLAGAAGAVWWYQYTRAAPGPGEQEVTAIVSNGNDRGPGTLREALFVVASAKEPATISIQTPRVVI